MPSLYHQTDVQTALTFNQNLLNFTKIRLNVLLAYSIRAGVRFTRQFCCKFSLPVSVNQWGNRWWVVWPQCCAVCIQLLTPKER